MANTWEPVPPLSRRWDTEQRATEARGEGLFCSLGKLPLGAAPTFRLLDTNISHPEQFPSLLPWETERLESEGHQELKMLHQSWSGTC